ncbi:oocyte zinc finger protein XlCOF7.1-like isoform X2 [Pseudophryne corroboree]
MKMDRKRSHMTETILNLTLKIIHLLTGKDYVAEKECCVCAASSSSRPSVSGGQTRTQSPITEPPPHSLIHERDKEQKILELTNKIIQLLTGEVPIRCQDVTIYLSMEEWEYVEGHKDLYEDVLENYCPNTSLGLHQVEDPSRVFCTSDSLLECTCEDDSAIAVSPASGANTTSLLKNMNEEFANAPKDNTRSPPTRTLDKSVSCGGVTLTDTDTNKPTDRRRYTSTPVKEATVSCDGGNLTDSTIYTPPDQKQYISTPIKEKSVLRKRDSKYIRTPTDNPPYTPVPVNEELMQYEEGPITGTGSYTPADCRQTQCTITGEPYNWTANAKAKYNAVLEKSKSNINRPYNKTGYLCLDTPQSTDKTYVCSKCGQQFTSESELTKHQTVHMQPGSFICPEYGKSVTARPNLVPPPESQLAAKSVPHDNRRMPSSHKSVPSSRETADKPFKCQQCGEGFISKFELVTHRVVHIRRPYACPDCGRRFFSRTGLATHQKTHTGQKLFVCPTCRKSFITKAHLLLHQEIHDGRKSDACSENGTFVGDDPSVGKGQGVNTEEKSFSCPECGEQFYSSEHFLQHQSRHFSNSPFICSDCGKCFRRKAGLAKHKRVIHQGDVMFNCFGCGKGFACKSELVRHVTVHTGEKPFSCAVCRKCFSFKSALVRHQRIHNGDRPHSCVECGKGFSCNSDLLRHQSVHQRSFSGNLQYVP